MKKRWMWRTCRQQRGHALLQLLRPYSLARQLLPQVLLLALLCCNSMPCRLHLCGMCRAPKASQAEDVRLSWRLRQFGYVRATLLNK